MASTILLFSCANGFAFRQPDRISLRNFDRRAGETGTNNIVSGNQQAAVKRLQARLPQVQVEFDRVSGAPRFISAGVQFLSGANGQGKGIPVAAAAKFAVTDPDRPTKAFLEEYRGLFGHGPEALDQARIKRAFVTPHNGLRTVVWEQHLNGIALFESVFISHTTARGELVNVSSQFLPDPEGAADRSVTNRAALLGAPDVSAQQAVVIAARNIGVDIDEQAVEPEETTQGAAVADPEKRQFFKSVGLKGKVEAELTWLPMSRDRLRLCWDVILMSRARGEMFRVLVDAQTGEPMLLRCLTDYLSAATYRVYTSDSPSPFSPGYSTPVTNQPPLTNRVLVTLPALDTNASPNGWIDDTGNETLGNNVDAHTDLNGDDIADLPRPQGSPSRVFDFSLDLTQTPITYTNAAVVQLFYWNNFMHDKLYELGFTEAAGNFQSNNFGRGGLGGDAVQADAQDGSGVNNANFSTPPDGSPGRMQMYIFAGATPNRDGDLDAEVILHEYTHGLSNRRVGGGVGISALQTAGMGEGWSDFCAMALLSQAGDDVNGVYAYGGYVTYLLSGLTQNYYFGIRRYPYCTDMSKNPLTFKDIDPAQASSHSGIPRSPIVGATANEVHNMGEVWCMALREARASLINKYGWAAGNQLSLELVVDGMNLSPPNPNFLQARDTVLQADALDNGAADLKELWTAFAKRGMGFSATSPSSDTTAGLQEAFDLPPDTLEILPLSGLLSSGPVGGPFQPGAQIYTLVNTGTNLLSWAVGATAPWIGLTPAAGTLANGSSLNITASVNSVANSLSKGNYAGTLWFTNLSSGGVASRPCNLVVGRGVVAWGGDHPPVAAPADLFNVVAITCGSYDTFALKRDGTVSGWGPNFDGQTNIPPGLSNVVALACGTLQTLAIKADGTVTAWGNDYEGQCDVPAGLTNAIAVAGGYEHSLALRADGTLIAWGANNYGQAAIPPGLSNVVAIAAGQYHNVALKADGTVACWGANYAGQSSPPAGLANVMAVAAGLNHTLALRNDGTVAIWGNPASAPAGLTNVCAIAANGDHDLALLADGTVAAWGSDLFGESEVPFGLTNVMAIAAGWYHSAALLNDGTLHAPFIFKQPLGCTIPNNDSAVFNVGAVGTPALNYRWKKNGVDLANGKTVSGADSAALVLSALTLADAGNYSVVVSNQNGIAMSSNASLTVLDPAIVQQPAGATNVFGTTATFSVLATGTSPLRYQWQKGGVNLVDGGNISGASMPTLTLNAVQGTDNGNYTVMVSDRKGLATSAVAALHVITAPEISRQPLNRTQLAGKNVSLDVLVRGAPPLHYQWVKNTTNYLTDGGNLSGALSFKLSLSNVAIADQAEYAVVITNGFASLTSSPAYLKINAAFGHIVPWGDNQYGQTNVPAGLTNVVALAAGGYHSVALTTGGTVVEWGDTNYIPGGTGNIMASATSENIDLVLMDDGSVGGWGLYGYATVPAGLSNVIAVAAGYDFSVGLKADGTATAWGNVSYQMTNALANLNNVQAISAGDSHLLLLNQDGTVTALGDNYAGQTNVPAGLSNVVAIAAGGKHSLALKSDSTVAAWGADWYGQAEVPAGLADVTAIGAGLGTSIAVKRDGTIVTWGQFDQGRPNVPPAGLTRVAAVTSGYTHSLALVNDVLPAVPQLMPSASGLVTNGAFKLVFAGDPGASYGVWGSTNLVSWFWLGYGGPLGNGLFQFIDPSVTSRPCSFYRAGIP